MLGWNLWLGLAGGIGLALLLRWHWERHRQMSEQHATAAHAYAETTHLLEAILQHTPMPTILLNAPGCRIRLLNPACRNLLGIPDELAETGLCVFDSAPGLTVFRLDGTPVALQDWLPLKVLDGIETRCATYQITRQDGTRRWVIADGIPLTDAQGSVTAGLITLQDITIRQHAEHTSRFLTNLFDHVSDAVIATDLKFQITSWNRGAEKIYGWSAGEALGKTVGSLLHTEYLTAENTAQVQIKFYTNGHWQGEVRQKNRHGADVYILASVSLLREQYGRPAGMVAVNRDITERKMATQALLEREAQYRFLVDHSPDGIVIHAQGIVTFINQAGAEILKARQPADLIGQAAIDFVHPSSRAKAQQRIQQITEQHAIAPWIQELFLAVDGSEVPVEVIAKPFPSPTQMNVLVVFRDITERQRNEAAILTLTAELEQRVLERTAKLEAANKELKDFAYVVSHDLKAPLRAISRLSTWLLEDYATAIDRKGQDMFLLLVRRVKRMDTLIDDILKYSRIGRIDGEEERIDLNALVREVFEQLAPPEEIEIQIETALPIIRAHRTRLLQVFQNLLNNAIKFNDKPHGLIRLGCLTEPERYRFYIADNGPGIEGKYHEKVFQLFQTLTPRDEHESTGIGLALVKKIVEMYGGDIWIESTLGAGTTFWFTCPATLQAEASCEAVRHLQGV